MVSSVRHYDVVNSTLALLPFGDPALLCNTGQDYGFQYISHAFVASEIGAGAGQTLDTASNPTSGFLFAQFQGASIKQVIYAAVKKDVTGANGGTIFRSFAWATVTPHIYNISFRVVNPTDTTAVGYNPNYASIYMLDTGSNATTQVRTGDRVVMLLDLGNS